MCKTELNCLLRKNVSGPVLGMRLLQEGGDISSPQTLTRKSVRDDFGNSQAIPGQEFASAFLHRGFSETKTLCEHRKEGELSPASVPELAGSFVFLHLLWERKRGPLRRARRSR